jgi:hypothetical protein
MEEDGFLFLHEKYLEPRFQKETGGTLMEKGGEALERGDRALKQQSQEDKHRRHPRNTGGSSGKGGRIKWDSRGIFSDLYYHM